MNEHTTSMQIMKVLQLILHESAAYIFFPHFEFSLLHMYRWVEFTKKSVAKRVAKMLNGEQIGLCSIALKILFVNVKVQRIYYI